MSVPRSRPPIQAGATLAAARECLQGGISVIPVKADGSKAPMAKWKAFQAKLPTADEVDAWFDRPQPPGIATVCGAVSGGLELLDFDHRAAAVFESWAALVEAERPGLVARLNLVKTPGKGGPGYHVRYRVAGVEVPGNTKLAVAPNPDFDPAKPAGGDNERTLTLIETRGEGGYALAPGSPVECHPRRLPYEHVGGPPLALLPTIGADERECLIRCARAIGEAGETQGAAAPASSATAGCDLRPGDDYDRRGPDWARILEPHGWRCVRQAGAVRYWRRPGKDGQGWSATTGHCTSNGAELFKVFSSSADPFRDDESYGKFRTLALLEHNGDLAAAAKELRRQGYGSSGGTPPGADPFKGKVTGCSEGGAAELPKATGWTFSPIPDCEFATADYRLTWLVKRLLVADQPGVIGGPMKCLKTSVAVDLAVSLASGTRFLDAFDVYAAVKTVVLSGEVGAATLQRSALQVRQARGVGQAALPLSWQFTIPQLSRPDHVAGLARGLEEGGYKVAIIDPLYLCLLAGRQEVSAANLYQMGPLLLEVAQACLGAGCTPLLIHHSVKSIGRANEQPQLADLSFGGIAEFARQWLMLSRREPYQGDPPHKLWLHAGGSAGQSGTWAVDIDDGTLDDDFGGRHWDVQVRPAGEEVKTRQGDAERKRAEKRRRKQSDDEQDILRAIDQADPFRVGVSLTKVCGLAGMSTTTADAPITRLVAARVIEYVPGFRVEAGNGAMLNAKGLRRVHTVEGI